MKKITIILKSGKVCTYTDLDEDTDKEKILPEISKIFQSSKVNVLDINNSIVFVRPSEIALLDISLSKVKNKENKLCEEEKITTGEK
jgi:predicted amino acid-binding ACT domain protein